MKQRVLLVGFVLWLGVVAVGSGLTWLVIQRVGHVVSSQGPVADAPVVGPVRTASPTPSSVPPVRSRTARPSATASEVSTPRSAPRRSPDAETAAPGTRAASPKPPAPRPTRRASPPTPAPSPEPRPATVTRTWSGTGGRVSVSCTGSRAALVSASPTDGWQVGVEERGPEAVEVRFQSDASEVRVQTQCVGAEPRFEVERTSDD